MKRELFLAALMISSGLAGGGGDKARIVCETLVPGTRISDVACRWGVRLQQIYQWRHVEGVTGRSPNWREAVAFVPIVTDAIPPRSAARRGLSAVIEVGLAGAVVGVVPGTDDAQLMAVLRP